MTEIEKALNKPALILEVLTILPVEPNKPDRRYGKVEAVLSCRALHTAIAALIERSVAQETERCAKIVNDCRGTDYHDLRSIVAAIRERGPA